MNDIPSTSETTLTDLAIYPVEEPAPSRTLVDILHATISSQTDAIAIDNGSARLSYGELAQQIGYRVEELRAAGVGRGDRVGVRISSGTLELYVSILAVLTAGAAYVPVDVDDPDERAKLVWTEANVCVVLTDNATLTKLTTPTSHSFQSPEPEDDAWIIFTSGSTGKPKGVAVTHSSAAALVDAESKLFVPNNPIAPGDRVLAGLSVAFDASCEEMWLAWRYGACLVPAPRSVVKAGAELGSFLTAQRITVVSTVPTLVALWPAKALEGLRVVILGGEACSPELATRLANSVEAVYNTYGPTETTIVACGSRLVTGEHVRIGLPLAGWKLAVVDPSGNPVRWGEEGELIIGGVGVARYLDPEKDKIKFVLAECFDGERSYQSGDLVRAEKQGLIFVGRNDEQIKLGGRRIELGEIDAALMMLPDVRAGASAIRLTETGNEVLVGYIVRESNAQPSSAVGDRELLRQVLPATLVPMLVIVDDLPLRTSGKVDRKALPWPPPLPPQSEAKAVLSTTTWLSEQWRRVLGIPALPDSNFFDLGGTSLAAAQLVSQLRQQCPTMSVADIYEYPTLAAMATRVDELTGSRQADRVVRPTARWVMLVQFWILFAELTFTGIRWLTAVAAFKKFFALRLGSNSWAGVNSLPWWLIAVLSAAFLTYPGRLLTAAGGVRLLMIGIKPGTYTRGGGTHLRLWGAERFVGLAGIGSIAGTQWARRYARLLGCKVENDAQIHALAPVTGLASFGAGSAVEPEADVAGWWIDGDFLHIGSVTIGEGAIVGGRATLMPDTVIEPYASVKPGVSVQGRVSGPGVPPSSTEKPVAPDKSFFTDFRYTSTLLLLDFLPIIPIAPVLGLSPAVVHDYSHFRELVLGLLKVALPGILAGMVLYISYVILLVRLASLAIRPGVYSWHSTTAWAAWLTHALMMDARATMFPIYASLITPRWLRLLGAHVGRYVEASTIVPIPSLLRVEDAAFLADDVLVSPIELNRGTIRLGLASVGVKAFVGNSGIVNVNTHVPDGSLVGVLGTAPNDIKAGSSWLGRPAISLPRKIDTFVDEALTFKPPTRLVVARGMVECWRILPLIISAMLTVCVSIAVLYFMKTLGFGWTLLIGGGLLIVAGVIACAVATLAKWLLVPVIRPGMQRPLWSTFVWRNELADMFVQCLAVPWLVRACYGTPVLSWWMCTLGAKIGPGVWLESHLLPEAELCELGAGATVNRGCVLQTHLFHDRILRLDRVVLERGATLGPYAISLPGTTVGTGTTIAPTSLVMRGEQIPPGTRWMGNPVRPWVEQAGLERSSGSLETLINESLSPV